MTIDKFHIPPSSKTPVKKTSKTGRYIVMGIIFLSGLRYSIIPNRPLDSLAGICGGIFACYVTWKLWNYLSPLEENKKDEEEKD
jgi:hypothetical protein